MTNTISRSQARTWTLGAQLASAVFVFGAVALGIVGLPEPTPGVPINAINNGVPIVPGTTSQSGTPSNNPAGEASQSNQIDTIGLAQRLALLDNAPTPVSNTTPDTENQDTGTQSSLDDGTIAKRVRYIGYINDPDTRHAFIRIDGKQRIVPLNGIAKAGNPEFADLTLERVTPAYIYLSDGENRAQVKLADRTGQSITMAGGGQVEVAAAAASETGSLLTAEDEAAIAALPPRQQQQARRRLERERRGLSPDPERRRPTPEPLASVRSSFNQDRQNNNRNRDD